MTPLAAIREYYSRIDQSDIDWVIRLFAEDAVYARADSCYEGKQRINEFFRIERKIRGKHRIDSLHAFDNQVFARGEFIGKGIRNQEKSVRFLDIWYFADNGSVSLRETYLALGQEYVKE